MVVFLNGVSTILPDSISMLEGEVNCWACRAFALYGFVGIDRTERTGFVVLADMIFKILYIACFIVYRVPCQQVRGVAPFTFTERVITDVVQVVIAVGGSVAVRGTDYRISFAGFPAGNGQECRIGR